MSSRHQQILSAICDLPTAPFREQHVIDWLLQWAVPQSPAIRTRRDRAGNVYLEYRHGRAKKNPLVIEAHMDHPGFIATRQKRDGCVEALFRGGVKPSHFKNATARFWLPGDASCRPQISQIRQISGDKRGRAERDRALPGTPEGRWLSTKVLSVKTVPNHRHMKVLLAPVREKIPPGTLAMWDLPDARVKGDIFSARVCDDLAGIAAIVCLFEELIAQKVNAHIIGLCSRGEEVGFAGVLAVCENGWIPRNSPVIGLETSKAFATAPQGGGPIIRVGDRTGIFSPGLTHFLTQTAGRIADDDHAFKYQRKLMDGGTCNSTAFAAYDYDSAGICLALGNYHNQIVKGEVGHKSPGISSAGPGIASETIDVRDFMGMVRLLVEAASRIQTYKPGLGPIRKRLSKMHRTEQRSLLYE